MYRTLPAKRPAVVARILTQVIKGKRGITAAAALSLPDALGYGGCLEPVMEHGSTILRWYDPQEPACDGDIVLCELEWLTCSYSHRVRSLTRCLMRTVAVGPVGP